MDELKKQIHAMVENWTGEILDAYACQDWGVNAETFCTMLVVYFNEYVRDLGKDIDAEDEELNALLDARN